jgi:hypothetical protein
MKSSLGDLLKRTWEIHIPRIGSAKTRKWVIAMSNGEE